MAILSEFVTLLREEAGPRHDELITDLFERITLYDVKAKDAPLAEAFEVGAFAAQPGKKGFSKASVLVVERRDIASGAPRITLVTDKLPKWVGIDPFNKRIDRNSDDNLAEVKAIP